MLPGYRRKQIAALIHNVEHLAAVHGIERIGFLTLTVGDFDGAGRFCHVKESQEAERRFHSVKNRIRERYLAGVVVRERHANNGLHFHLLVVVGADIRTGVDFEAFRMRDYRTAPLRLRLEWQWWREHQRRYGLGRHELLPINTTPGRVARYAAKYIGKTWECRLPEDKGAKLVRYFGRDNGWGKSNSPPMSCHHGTVTPQAGAWRECMKQIALRLSMEGIVYDSNNAKLLSCRRWAWQQTKAIQAFRFFTHMQRLTAATRIGLEAHNATVARPDEERFHVGGSQIGHWMRDGFPISDAEIEECRRENRRAKRIAGDRVFTGTDETTWPMEMGSEMA